MSGESDLDVILKSLQYHILKLPGTRFIYNGLFVCLCVLLLPVHKVKAQSPGQRVWQASVERKDGKPVFFQMIQTQENNRETWYVKNADEKIPVTEWREKGDSVFFSLPAFEVSFRARREGKEKLNGQFIKLTTGSMQYWPFVANAKDSQRFVSNGGKARGDISGKWDVTLTRANGTTRKALAIFTQEGSHLTGTFLTPSADYRYLDGMVTGDSLKISSFDGDNIRLFEAKITSENSISGGFFYNGYTGKESWTAVRTESMPPPVAIDPPRMREGETRLNFRFRDLQGKWVSINDEKYRHKVVIVQLMGSWCANCLDETRFLVDFYNENHEKGVEIIALTYEYSTDTLRSKKSVEKFRKFLGVPYPILLTGVTAGDEQKTEKTLPQLTDFRSFPTTLILDREGRVRKIETSFYGPGSGEYYIKYRNEFNTTLDELIRE
jgi:thiol-disulfide isomerase/thioredoxin